MTGWSFSLAPLIAWPWIAALTLVLAAIAALSFIRRLRGRWLRLAAGVVLLLAALNPVLLNEKRDALKSTVAIVVDRSPSQRLDGRGAQTDAALKGLLERIGRCGMFEPPIPARAVSPPCLPNSTSPVWAMNPSITR